MSNGFLNVPWFVWGGVAALISLVWLFWPGVSAIKTSSGLRYIILRWFHGFTWLLLALSFFVRSSNAGLANQIALAGLAAYLLFIGAVLTRS
jgi:hypothetical protein